MYLIWLSKPSQLPRQFTPLQLNIETDSYLHQKSWKAHFVPIVTNIYTSYDRGTTMTWQRANRHRLKPQRDAHLFFYPLVSLPPPSPFNAFSHTVLKSTSMSSRPPPPQGQCLYIRCVPQLALTPSGSCFRQALNLSMALLQRESSVWTESILTSF